MSIYKLWQSRKPGVKLPALRADPGELFFETVSDRFYVGQENLTPRLWEPWKESGATTLSLKRFELEGTYMEIPSSSHAFETVLETVLLNQNSVRVEASVNLNLDGTLVIDSNVDLADHQLLVYGFETAA